MINLDKKLWLARSKLHFLLTPEKRRVRLEITTDGRQLTYLLASLHALGFAIHVVESPMLFRELFSLRESMPIPFIIGGTERECSIVVSDRPEVINEVVKDEEIGIFLDDDYFNREKTDFRMPYFMHPSVYHEGLDRMSVPSCDNERSVRIGFFGTRDTDFYTRDFYFPMMNREDILKAFMKGFGARISEARLPVSSWANHEIVMSVDTRGGDQHDKSFLPLRDYLDGLRSCDFFLSPPGWCMPLSHNLIEGMAAGTIPIINSSQYLYPALEHEVNCLSFSTAAELNEAVEMALSLSSSQIKRLRANVIKYYDEHLKAGRWLGKAIERGDRRIIVNAEERSIKSCF